MKLGYNATEKLSEQVKLNKQGTLEKRLNGPVWHTAGQSPSLIPVSFHVASLNKL